jgi:hypothetical protein
MGVCGGATLLRPACAGHSLQTKSNVRNFNEIFLPHSGELKQILGGSAIWIRVQASFSFRKHAFGSLAAPDLRYTPHAQTKSRDACAIALAPSDAQGYSC